jgi:SAM-dependent methyltransferase
MRERVELLKTIGHEDNPPPEGVKLAEVKTYFSSFYKSTIRDGEPLDRHTIPGITEVETRFHYNATENSIIRALIHLVPLPIGAEIWHFTQQRQEWKVLDIGSGTGHWIDFYRRTFFAAHVTGIEIVDEMAAYLKEKYAADDAIEIFNTDISGPDCDFPVQYDLINAIGVMFHIVDDGLWRNAMRNIVAATKPGGILVIGGDFGPVSRNNQFHKKDEFSSWREHASSATAEAIVNKRLRSLSEWQSVAQENRLEVVDLVRSDIDQHISTPENDVLLLRKPAD